MSAALKPCIWSCQSIDDYFNRNEIHTVKIQPPAMVFLAELCRSAFSCSWTVVKLNRGKSDLSHQGGCKVATIFWLWILSEFKRTQWEVVVIFLTVTAYWRWRASWHTHVNWYVGDCYGTLDKPTCMTVKECTWCSPFLWAFIFGVAIFLPLGI